MKNIAFLLAIFFMCLHGFAHAETVVFVGDGNSCKPFLDEHDKNIRPEHLLDYLNRQSNLWSIIKSEKAIHFCSQKAADKYYLDLLKNKNHQLTVAEFLLNTSVVIPLDDVGTGISRSALHEENYKLGRAFLLQNSIKHISNAPVNNHKKTCDFVGNNQSNLNFDDEKWRKPVTLVFPYDYLLVSKINNCAAEIYAIKKDKHITSMGNKIPLLINETLLLYIFEKGDKFEFYANEFFKKINYSGNITTFRLNQFTKKIVFFETHWSLASKGNQETILKTMEQHIKQLNANNPSTKKCLDNNCLILHFLLDSMHHWISFKRQESKNSLSSTDLDKYIELAKKNRSTAMPNTIYISEINRLSILEQAIYDYGLKNRLFNNQKYADFYTSIIEHGFGMKTPDCFQSNCFKVMPAIQDYYLYVADSNSLLKKRVDASLSKLKKQQCSGMRSLHAQDTDDISFDYPCETILEPIKPSTLTISGEKEE